MKFINSKTISSLLLILVLYGCSKSPSDQKEISPPKESGVIVLTDEQAKNAGIKTGKLSLKNISSVIKVSGRIDVPPQNMVSVSVPLGGYLKSSRLLPGMHLNKGEVIAVMEDQQYIQLQQDYLTAKVRLIFIQGEYDRQRVLNQSKATSDKAFQQMESDYGSQKILVKALGQKLLLIGIDPGKLNEESMSRSVSVYSPITGYVSKVNMNIGKYANPSDVLFEIVNPSDIHLALTIYEKDLAQLYIGQVVRAYTNNNPDKKYKCKIILIGQDLTSDRSTEVHCHFENYDNSLVPGMYMNADIEIQNTSVFALPEAAVLNYDKKTFVCVQKEINQWEMIEVRTGKTEGGFVQIFIDDKFKDSFFAVSGAYSLLMKIKNISE